LGFEFRQGQEISLFPETSRPALALTKSPVQWVPGFFTGGKEARV
jgi:hypothetical protein